VTTLLSGTDLHLWDLEAGRLVARVPPVGEIGGGGGGGGAGSGGWDGGGSRGGGGGGGSDEAAAAGNDAGDCDEGDGGGSKRKAEDDVTMESSGGGGGAETEAFDPGDDGDGTSSGAAVPERWQPGWGPCTSRIQCDP
jgi:hypothetical protein